MVSVLTFKSLVRTLVALDPVPEKAYVKYLLLQLT